MSREIVTADRGISEQTRVFGVSPPGQERGVKRVVGAEELPRTSALDGYSDRLLKYIPTEVVAVYVAASATIKTSSVPHAAPQAMVAIFLTIMTPLYLWRVLGVRNKMQLSVSTASFVVWVVSLGGISDTPLLPPLYCALLLMLFTFSVGLIMPGARKHS